MAHGVDDPYRGEVGFLGRVEAEGISATGPLRKGMLDHQAGGAFNSTPNCQCAGRGVCGDQGKLPLEFVYSL